jgi:ABC-type lipoprotein release transport system permease subunit
MKIFDIFRFALRNFFRRKARSLLTILGVVIGTMSVVTMLSISEALNVGSMQMVEQWGSLTEITVQRDWSGEEGAPKLTDHLVARINALENVEAVMPIRTMNVPFRITRGREELAWVQFLSVDMAALASFGHELELGRWGRADGSYEMVMGYEIPFRFIRPGRWEDMREAVFYDWCWETQTLDIIVNPLPSDPTQEDIRIVPGHTVEPGKPRPRPINADVVGVMKWDQNSWQFNNSIMLDSVAFDVLEAELQRAAGINPNQNQSQSGISFGRGVMVSSSVSVAMPVPGRPGGNRPGNQEEQDKFENIYVKVNHMDNVLTVQQALRDLGLGPRQIHSNMDNLERVREQFAFTQMVLGGIGLVAFLVAALGIANTMIMSTYERTREIGVMKVMGCKLGDILNMFLTESAIIGLFGGAVGVALSFGASFVLNNFVDASLFGISGWGNEDYALSIIPYWLPAAGLVFTAIVGIISGLYPSIRAMRMSTLEAIKNE